MGIYFTMVFFCPVSFSKDKFIRVKKKKLLEKYEREKCFKFVNNSWILPFWQISFLFLFISFGIHELFLFLFVQKLAPRIYSYSDLQEKKLLADHWFGAIWSHLEPVRVIGVIWSNLELFGAIWSHLEPIGGIWCLFEPFGAIWSHLEPFGGIWSHLDTLGYI